MLSYEQGSIPSVFSKLKQAFHCSKKTKRNPKPEIYLKKRFLPLIWKKYSWSRDGFDKMKVKSPFVNSVYLSSEGEVIYERRVFRRTKSAGYVPDNNSIYFKEIKEGSLFAEFGHYLRLSERTEDSSDEYKFCKALNDEMIFVPLEDIVYEPAQPLIKFMQDLPPMFKRNELPVNMSEFFDALAQEVHESGSVSTVRENFEKHSEYLKNSNHGDVRIHRIISALISGVMHFPYVAVEKIDDVSGFLDQDPELIRKPKEQIIEEYYELFEDLFSS